MEATAVVATAAAAVLTVTSSHSRDMVATGGAATVARTSDRRVGDGIFSPFDRVLLRLFLVT